MKKLILYSLLISSFSLFAGKGYILNKSSLECYKNGQAYTLKNNVVINFTDEEREKCFGKPFYNYLIPFKTVYNEKPQNNISFKIKGHPISCILPKEKKLQTTRTISTRISQDLLLFQKYNDGQFSTDKRTLKQWASFDPYGKDVEGRYSPNQELPYSFENGKPTIDPRVLKGERHFGHGTNRDTREKFHWYLKGKSSQIQITESFNQVEGISCPREEDSPEIGSNLHLQKETQPNNPDSQSPDNQMRRI